MATIITSQSYINYDIVAEKSAARDYVVLVTPEIEVDGDVVRLIIDGNHSYQAAIDDGVEPELVEATAQDCDALCLPSDQWLDALYDRAGCGYLVADTMTAMW